VIDDDAGDAKLLTRGLRDSGLPCRVRTACGMAPALAAEMPVPELVFLDYGLPGAPGLDNLARLRRRWPEAGVIVVTGQGDEVIAAAVIKAGAVDYIPKRHISGVALNRLLHNALKVTRLRRQVAAQRRELDSFAHTLAHDLKAPLRALAFFTTQVTEGLARGDPAAAQGDLAEIDGLAHRLNRTIDDLTAHLRPGHAGPHQPEEAGALWQAAAANLRAEITERGARLLAEPLPRLRCNGSAVIRLFQNLIGNGLKYCPHQRPEIRVRAGTAPGGLWQFAVSDNGIGVPAAHAERIFEPFLRLHREEEIPGTGLGLATCARIVAHHGGRIWCAPQPRGTTICFTLPGVAATLPAAAPPDPPRPQDPSAPPRAG
jgi:hypothetical protein